MKDSSSLTMKDIARELGISIATVSRALKDSPRISEERRKVIQQYAREHNFTPNVLAESLRRSKVQPLKIIGVIIPEFVHYYFSTAIHIYAVHTMPVMITFPRLIIFIAIVDPLHIYVNLIS